MDSLSGNDFFKRNIKAREHTLEEFLQNYYYPHVLREHLHARLHKQKIDDDKDK